MRLFLSLLFLLLPLMAQRDKTVSLRSQLRAELRAARDLGALNDNQVLDSIEIRFARTAAQQEEIDRLLEALHNPASPDYRRWLSPEKYAERFGASAADRAKLRTWLESEGFEIRHESRSATYISIAGTARGLRRSFGASLRRYEIDGKEHFATSTVPRIPEAFSSLILDIGGLDNFLPEPNTRIIPLPDFTRVTGEHYLVPDDFAAIYNLQSSYRNGIDGRGQKIVVAGQSAIDLDDMRNFRARFNLPAADPQVILYPGGTDPGFTGSQIEANLDLQWAGAVARNATLYYVYGRSVASAVAYAIDQNIAPIVSVSFGFGCEAQNSFATMTALRNLAQQANAQGITWVNSSGDAGPAACELNGSPIAENGYGIRVPANIPEVTAVGGTELDDRGGTYWRSTNDANQASALSYIPEIPWNQSVTENALYAGGGGVGTFHPRPSWQAGPGVGNETFRTTPDVSLAASRYNGYYISYRGTGLTGGGTSAAAPAFAGMLSLILQATNQGGLGNVNRLLYPLAQSNPEAFHDVTRGDTIVPCAGGSRDCAGGSIGFRAGPGYDLATGLGSVDFEKLAQAWPRAAATQSLVTISIDKNPVYAQASATGLTWTFTLGVKEEAGVATRITSVKRDGVDFNTASAALASNGSLFLPITERGLAPPLTRVFEVGGQDANGQNWTRTISVQFLDAAPQPVIGGVAHGASGAQTFAPGMILSVYGSTLAPATQVAAALPLLGFTGGISAMVNGVTAPFYFVSPGQVNLQIPYATAVGSARLVVNYGTLASASFTFNVSPTAPGIFTFVSDGFVNPSRTCGRGQTCTLFITGQGAVSPAIATGAAPLSTSTLENLPRPAAEVSMTIGGVPAQILFAGIPAGLVGVTQINFTVAGDTPTGTQNVIVRVGGADSAAAKLNVP